MQRFKLHLLLFTDGCRPDEREFTPQRWSVSEWSVDTLHGVKSPSGATSAPSTVLGISCVQQTGDHQTRTRDKSLIINLLVGGLRETLWFAPQRTGGVAPSSD
ncbi:hypothetical protein VZT92_001202 [Zoarces viviparus]|uniref:Uncharacterized protein n=1 Tax=Zoarces viviparus TaxID=48416 RepID=A0AAW1G4V2_ZOAVI